MEPTFSTASACADEGTRLIKSGSPIVAYDTLADGLVRWPADVRLRQLTALALIRSGAGRLAEPILDALVSDGLADEETLGLLGRVHKDLAGAAVDPTARTMHLEEAYRAYADAHERSGGYWTGINAATMALLLGQASEARAIADTVRDRCRDLLEHTLVGSDAYWLCATLGEAALVQGDLPEAEHWYRRAAALATHRLGDLASTRRNARLLARHAGLDSALVDRWLPVPRVVVFAGHLIDRPGRPRVRFPPDLEAPVREALRSWLARTRPGFGYAAAACGADILFLEALLDAGVDAHVVLPYDREQFRRDSVDVVPGAAWSARFDRVLAGASGVTMASEQRMQGSLAYSYGLLVLDGMAAMRAEELDTSLTCLAVWDGEEGDDLGGTASAVAHWRALGRDVDVIDLAALRAGASPTVVARTADDPGGAVEAEDQVEPSDFSTEIVGLLFGDVRGFSRLTEEQIPPFVTHVLGTIASELERSPHTPLLVNTWGDGLYVVSRTVRETGELALQLADALREQDWAAHGLPADLGFRVGVHAGPAYACIDPVTGRRNYVGAHVSRAARIEPITPPGEVYASGPFAALARAEGVTSFTCTYVGHTPRVKGEGASPTYVVTRR